MKWRLIEEEPFNASMNMAIDHAIYESVANGREHATIRFYKWASASVSLGAYQGWNEINVDECRKHDVGIVRRMTGGSAVFHDRCDFAYSVIAHIRNFNYSVQNACMETCFCVIDALESLGIKASLENRNDIIVRGKKISANAAKAMEKGVYLQHGNIAYDVDFGMVPKILNVPQESAKSMITAVLQQKKIPQRKVYEALKEGFIFGKEFKAEKVSEYELERAQELAKTRYSEYICSDAAIKSKGACHVGRG